LLPIGACRRWPRIAVVGAAMCGAALRAAAAALPGPGSAEPASLTVADCVRLARERAPSVTAAAADYRAASLDSTAAWRTRRWTASVFTDATLAPRGSYDPTFTNLGQYELKAGVEVPLLDGGSRRRERERGTLAARAFALALRQARRDAGLRSAALAVQALELGEKAAAQVESAAWLARLESLMESGVAGGVRSRSDALRVTIERDVVETALAATRRDMDAAVRELNQLLGRPPEDSLHVRVPDSTDERGPGAGDVERLAAGAERAPEVLLAGVSEAESRLDLAEVRSRTAPRAEVGADGGMAGTDLTQAVPPDIRASNPGATFADRLRRDLGSSASMRVSMPLFDASVGPAAAARRAATEAAGIRRELERSTQRRVGLDLIAAWRSAHERLLAARLTADRAEQHLLRMKSLHAAGAASLLELLDARSVASDANERLVEARADDRLARVTAELRQ